MLCSEVHLVKAGDGFDDLKPLPCNRWTCDLCAPKRRRRLMALAASGEPDKVLTLTVNNAVGTDPTNRRNLLHDAWKRLVKRILRQFALAPEKRWTIKSNRRSARQSATILAITKATPARGYDKMNYMAFLERTKAAEPHLHILLRSPYIPQDWLAEQMLDMIASPVVWIEKVRGVRGAISYLTKYITKEPAQFGTGKRYWVSRGWEVNTGDKAPYEPRSMVGVRVVREPWPDVLRDRDGRTCRRDLTADGWHRFWHPAAWQQAEAYYEKRSLAFDPEGEPPMSAGKLSGGVCGGGDRDPHGFAVRCSPLEPPF